MKASGWPRRRSNFTGRKPEELAHYAKATVDILFKFPFGTQELEGIAARGDFDLTQHQKFSGKSMEYFDEEAKANVRPACHRAERRGGPLAPLRLDLQCLSERNRSPTKRAKAETRVVMTVPSAGCPDQSRRVPAAEKQTRSWSKKRWRSARFAAVRI